MSNFWKKDQEEMIDDKTFTKKHQHYFGSQSKISKFSLKILKFLGTSWASVIAHKHLLL